MAFIETTKHRIKDITPIYSDQDLIRSAIIAELDATSLYQSQLKSLYSEDAQKVIKHIIDEEKEHISELYCLLMKLDKDQMNKMGEVDPTTCIAH
jgi:rubrerythrin